MPIAKEKEPVEGFKLTEEMKAFYKTYRKVTQMQGVLKKGIAMQMTKLQSMQEMSEQIEGKRKELMLKAPTQSAFESADEGMIEEAGGMRKVADEMQIGEESLRY